jgi:hypothetical protein
MFPSLLMTQNLSVQKNKKKPPSKTERYSSVYQAASLSVRIPLECLVRGCKLGNIKES